MKIGSIVTLVCCFSLIFEAKAQREYPDKRYNVLFSKAIKQI